MKKVLSSFPFPFLCYFPPQSAIALSPYQSFLLTCHWHGAWHILSSVEMYRWVSRVWEMSGQRDPVPYPKSSNPRPSSSRSLPHTQSRLGSSSISGSTSTSEQWKSPRVEQHQQHQETDPVDNMARLWTDNVSLPLCLDEMTVQSPASGLWLCGPPVFPIISPSLPSKRTWLTSLIERPASYKPFNITRSLWFERRS